ncbi:MAG: cell envelope integrity protein CreD [Acidobacteriaceae bacterium]|nr:cell envelope integrity protein CreD [Acidobacteriaceae bacterium]
MCHRCAQARRSSALLVIPFTRNVQVSSTEDGRTVIREQRQDNTLVVAPTEVAIDTHLNPELRTVSIYQAVVYAADIHMQGSFALPDFSKLDIDPTWLHLDRTQISMSLSSAKGLAGSQPALTINGRPLALMPGSGVARNAGNGFSGRLDEAPSPGRAIPFDLRFELRGHDAITLAPSAQETRWHVSSSWPSPGFSGSFLPVSRSVTPQGFDAEWVIGNLALNRPIVSIGERNPDYENQVNVTLVNSVDLYSEVNRAVKYGFLFIGFTFVALLMFDILLGVNVPGPAYMLVGIGLILFFVLLLAFAEVVGFVLAYLVASGAIIALLSCYVAAILKTWRRGILVGAMLAGLYGLLYVLLSLEAYALLIGSLLIFSALAAVMYFTRNVNWRLPSDQTRDA